MDIPRLKSMNDPDVNEALKRASDSLLALGEAIKKVASKSAELKRASDSLLALGEAIKKSRQSLQNLRRQ